MCVVAGRALRDVRVVPVAGEPAARVRPARARAVGRRGRRARRRRHHAARRLQDGAQHAGKGPGPCRRCHIYQVYPRSTYLPLLA